MLKSKYAPFVSYSNGELTIDGPSAEVGDYEFVMQVRDTAGWYNRNVFIRVGESGTETASVNRDEVVEDTESDDKGTDEFRESEIDGEGGKGERYEEGDTEEWKETDISRDEDFREGDMEEFEREWEGEGEEMMKEGLQQTFDEIFE